MKPLKEIETLHEISEALDRIVNEAIEYREPFTGEWVTLNGGK